MKECQSIFLHVFVIFKTRSTAAMRFCTCHGRGIIETAYYSKRKWKENRDWIQHINGYLFWKEELGVWCLQWWYRHIDKSMNANFIVFKTKVMLMYAFISLHRYPWIYGWIAYWLTLVYHETCIKCDIWISDSFSPVVLWINFNLTRSKLLSEVSWNDISFMYIKVLRNC